MMTQKLVEVEVAHKIGAEKGKHETNRVTYRSGIRVRRFDTRLGTLYLVIPKLRKGGYIPFFVTERNGASWRWSRSSRRPGATGSRRERWTVWRRAWVSSTSTPHR